MSQQKINYSQPNDNFGDTLRNAFVKTDANFDELYQNKVDKITGKGLSDVNFSQADKTKLDAIDASAKVQSDFNQNDNLQPDFIKNKPTLLSEFDNDLEFIEDVQTGGQYVRESGQWVAADKAKVFAAGELLIFKTAANTEATLQANDFCVGIVEGQFIQADYLGGNPSLLSSFNL